MSYRYVSGGHDRYGSRDEWLNAITTHENSPKPPEWWLSSQEAEEGRSRKTASIIWGRNYDAGRKFVIWSQAPIGDFLARDYYRGPLPKEVP
jgi:hypothetical protein